MALTGQFGQIRLKDVEGYRISACFTPNEGFVGNFYVYIWDRMDAKEKPGKGIDLGERGERARATLELSDGFRHYQFADIDLNYADIGATRRERFRFLEFKYTKDVIDGETTVVTTKYTGKQTLERGALKDDYKYNLDNTAEHLLGFRTLMAGEGSEVVRFSSLRNTTNSFLEKALSVNKKPMDDWAVKFSQLDFDVNNENLLRLFVEESYGEMRGWAPRPMIDYVGQPEVERLVRSPLGGFSARDLLDHDASPEFKSFAMDPITVEVATFVFQPGTYRERLKEIT